MRTSIAIPVVEESQIGGARRLVGRYTEEIGADGLLRDRVGLIVTELAANLAKYAQNGQIVVRALGSTADAGIEVLSLDSGPGIADIAKCRRDGYSTSGTPGNGLGAVERLSRRFDIYSAPRRGTAILCHVGPEVGDPTVPRIEIGAVSVPMRGEDVCGDGWVVHESADRLLLMVIDGLGHGPVAAEASREAIRVFSDDVTLSPTDILTNVHGALRSTRGAVGAVSEAVFSDRSINFTGVGNISACILGDAKTNHMISLSGTLGLAAKIRPYRYEWTEDAVVVMSSDGLTSHWDLESFPGLLSRHPALIAGVLYQNYCRGRDDATVIVARWNGK